MKLGYNQATGMGCSTLEQDLRLCEEVGFDYIEMRLDMLRDYLQTHTLEELCAFFASSRLKPHALNAIYAHPALLKGENRRAAALLEEFDFACDLAARTGAGALIVVPPLMEDRISPYPGGWSRRREMLVGVYRLLGDRARTHGVRLCLELVGAPYCSCRTVADAKEVVEAVDHPLVGYVFDSYNLHLYHKLNEFSALEAVDPAKIFAVHINDGDDLPEAEMTQETRCFCGHGVLDLGGYLSALKHVGYDGMVSIETFRPAYWRESPRWVVETAWRTTRDMLMTNDCL